MALDPRVRTYWLVQGVLAVCFVVVLVIAGAVVAAVLDATLVAWLVGGIGGLVVVVLAVLAVVSAGLDWLWRQHQVVPHARVQTVDTTAGPLMRWLGLVSVEVQTASAAGSTSIPGLTPDVADALVSELARRAGIEEGT